MLALLGSIYVVSILAVIAVVALLLSVESESSVGATIVLVTTLLFVWVVYDFNVIVYVLANIQYFLLGLIGYFIAGAIWARVKWRFFIRACYAHFVDNKPTFFKSDSTFRYKGDYQKIPPQTSDNKSRIVLWMTYWPVSMTWTLINDPIRKIFNWIYEVTAKSFQSDSDKVFADIVAKNEQNK